MPHRTSVLNATVMLLTLFQFQSASAQQETDGSNNAVYQVELLVFRHLDQSRSTPELPRQQQQDMARDIEEELERLQAPQSTGEPASAGERPDIVEQRQIFAIVRNNEALQLNAAAERLRRLDAYEVVAHVAWTQQAASPAQAKELDLAMLGVPMDQLSGKVRLFQRRYLHLELDLRLSNSASSIPGVRDLLTNSSAAPAITESRRIRLERLNYFDQPQFGILAAVKATNQSDQQ